MTLCSARESLLRTANWIANGIASDILEEKRKWKLRSRAEDIMHLFLFLFTASSTVVAGESGLAVLDLICLCLSLFTPLFCGLALYIFAFVCQACRAKTIYKISWIEQIL